MHRSITTSKTTTALILSLIATVGIASWTFASQKPIMPNEVMIQLTENGFRPRTAIVKKGTAVRWINKTETGATVNSADHSTHSKHTELNLGTFSNNSTLVHTFDASGTYEYHDHFNPQRTGIVIVNE